jgi:4-hydroxy-tetrahydrodipicolinate reductase
MGQQVVRLAREAGGDAQVIFGVDVQSTGDFEGIPCATSFDGAPADVDCVIDFSHHANTEALLAFACKNNLPIVIATTGQTEAERAAIGRAAGEIPVFFTANFSLGIALLIDFAKKAAQALPDAEIEIVETHHDQKLDAPSGTALAIAEGIRQVRPEAENQIGRCGQKKREKNEIGIHALRIGGIVGEHEVLFGTQNQTLTLKHTAHSRAVFAEGALSAAHFIVKQGKGLYTMTDLAK